VEIFLWSGNCRPGPEALKIVNALGMENMNGGDTMISRRRPSLTAIAPRTAFWDGEMQIHAAVQNEVVFTKGFEGPRYGGYKNVIDTFKMTESPKRIKPVNIYYHFFSADRGEGLKALEIVHDWAMSQPLHAITAREYAQIVRDIRDTRVYQAGKDRWLLINHGIARTFRMDADGKVPDMAQSKGIRGYNQEGDFIYISTDGLDVSKLVMTDKPGAGLYMMSCSGPVKFSLRDRSKAVFTVKDYRPVKIIFGGVSPKQNVSCTVNGKKIRIQTDGRGRLTLDLPAEATVTLEIPAP